MGAKASSTLLTTRFGTLTYYGEITTVVDAVDGSSSGIATYANDAMDDSSTSIAMSGIGT